MRYQISMRGCATRALLLLLFEYSAYLTDRIYILQKFPEIFNTEIHRVVIKISLTRIDSRGCIFGRNEPKQTSILSKFRLQKFVGRRNLNVCCWNCIMRACVTDNGNKYDHRSVAARDSLRRGALSHVHEFKNLLSTQLSSL